ncbi:MAG TPA: TIM barrel protein, partial [Aggregatilineales bacterium]|nr:TIM barrel protein [Aggregatilineales bacterium]
MEIACHAWAYNDRSLEEAVGTIARLGFRNIDLGSGPHLDLDTAATQPARAARRVTSLLEMYHLELTDLYLMLPYINAPEENRRRAQIALFERLLPFAISLGTPGITISPGIQHPDGAEHSLARSLPALIHMSRIVEDTDLRLSYEPHMDSAVMKPEN